MKDFQFTITHYTPRNGERREVNWTLTIDTCRARAKDVVVEYFRLRGVDVVSFETEIPDRPGSKRVHLIEEVYKKYFEDEIRRFTDRNVVITVPGPETHDEVIAKDLLVYGCAYEYKTGGRVVRLDPTDVRKVEPKREPRSPVNLMNRGEIPGPDEIAREVFPDTYLGPGGPVEWTTRFSGLDITEKRFLLAKMIRDLYVVRVEDIDILNVNVPPHSAESVYL